MKILGIETSCDETAVAIVEDGKRVIVSHVLSQIDRHKVFGGVVPEVAAREHLKAIDGLVDAALRDGGLNLSEIDAIAVTQGPGLVGALLVGVSYAKGLSLASGLPLIPVNHVHAHIHGALLEREETKLPAIALVISGGHTNIYAMDSLTQVEKLAHTIDDACGECFDKVAKVFGLGYPGGPIVERTALEGDRKAVAMPKMVEDKSRLLFSYSGLKTYMVNLYNRESKPLAKARLADIMASFQEEALGQIVRKTVSALKLKPETKTVLVAGGVAANKRFRELMAEQVAAKVVFPNLAYCADNAAMIAALAYHKWVEVGYEDKGLAFDCYSRYPY